MCRQNREVLAMLYPITNMDRKEIIRNSKSYQRMQQLSTYLDKYYLDAVLGLAPGGIGDVFTTLFSLAHVYFSIFKLRSIPLTLAIVNNILRDLFLGLIPFYIGDAIDFFHKSNLKNMQLIDGFINDDAVVIHRVNKKATISVVFICLLAIAIVLMVVFVIKLAERIGLYLLG